MGQQIQQYWKGDTSKTKKKKKLSMITVLYRHLRDVLVSFHAGGPPISEIADRFAVKLSSIL